MNFYNYIFIILLILTFILALVLYLNFKKLKVKENQKLTLINNALESEKQNSKNSSIKTHHEIELLEKNTHRKFLKLRVLIFNTDFTLQEIFNKLS